MLWEKGTAFSKDLYSRHIKAWDCLLFSVFNEPGSPEFLYPLHHMYSYYIKVFMAR